MTMLNNVFLAGDRLDLIDKIPVRACEGVLLDIVAFKRRN